jgi:hypothetical protein
MLTHITNEEWRTRHGRRSEVIKWKLRGSYNLHATVIKKLGYYSHARQVQHLVYFSLSYSNKACSHRTTRTWIFDLSLLTESWDGYQSPCCLCDFWTNWTIFMKLGMKIILRPPRQLVITIWRTTFRSNTSATIYVAYGRFFKKYTLPVPIILCWTWNEIAAAWNLYFIFGLTAK